MRQRIQAEQFHSAFEQGVTVLDFSEYIARLKADGVVKQKARLSRLGHKVS